jgi:flagellar basal-body rod protein FlgF
MDRGLFIAASGMLAEMARQDLLANDLANASTPGYKADRATQHSFAEVLLQNTRTGQTVGSLGTGSAITRQVTDFTPAPLRDTNEDLDFAVVGEGFFAVRTAQGVRYTRNGSFQQSANGELTDQLGNRVLGQNGRPVRVTAEGSVPPDQLGVFALRNPNKAGDGLITGTAAGRGGGQVRAGALETSGIDPARAMIDMISSLRAFEAGQKAIQTIDRSLEQAASKVGAKAGY